VDRVSAVDHLGRVAVARHVLKLLRAIDAADGAVIGLEGEWGSGKTWVIDKLLDLSQESEAEVARLVFVKFNPWMVSGAGGLVEALLIQLAGELGRDERKAGVKNAAEIAVKLIDYASVLGTVKHVAPLFNLMLPGSGLLVEAAGHAIGEAATTLREDTKGAIEQLRRKPETLSIQSRRKSVDELLKNSGYCIVVVIDDLDRLAPPEFAAMVQAVKAVADFPNVIYLLAYDPAVAAKAIERGLSVEDGRRYLEKIVQVALPIPEVPAFKFQRYAEKLLVPTKIRDERDRKDIDRAIPIVAALMQSPRDIERLRTRLLIAIPALEGEVSLADLMLIEALQLKNPALVKWVDENKSVFLKARLERRDQALLARGDLGDPYEGVGENDDEKAKRKNAVHQLVADLLRSQPKIEVQTRNALAYLFDEMERFDWRSEGHSSWLRLQRVRKWITWRAYVKHDEILSTEYVRTVCECPEFAKQGRPWSSVDDFLELCQLIADDADDLTKVDAVEFGRLLVDAAVRFGDEPIADWGTGFGPWAAFEVLLRCDAADRRHLALERMIQTATVRLSWGILRQAVVDSRGSNWVQPLPVDRRMVPNESELQALEKLWLDQAWKVLDDLDAAPAGLVFLVAAWICQVDAVAASKIRSEPPRFCRRLRLLRGRSPDVPPEAGQF
jgi:hypothetical protein